ncbi:CRISPR-associated endonuclease Cas1 [Bradyrhizobium commune]|uniref:CRISPR-associated endonuclease Cas1 n=1 Tax=Bradyrhizobium commune TaxID=83627 RepID=A0A7S9D1W1_9BRAD|nr:CRISPR-associated endonuclease Cas1 [Bradyrhizobium commune]
MIPFGSARLCDKNRAALVFDLMEPLRPLADRLVLERVRSETFKSGDLKRDGAYRLKCGIG